MLKLLKFVVEQWVTECYLWYDGKRDRRGDSKFSNRPISLSNRIGPSDSKSNRISKLRRSLFVNDNKTYTRTSETLHHYPRAAVHRNVAILELVRLRAFHHLSPIKKSYLKRSKSYRVNKQDTHTPTNRHYWKQYHIAKLSLPCAY